jgi:hypothetical protein
MSEILDLKSKKENCKTEINKLKLDIEKDLCSYASLEY